MRDFILNLERIMRPICALRSCDNCQEVRQLQQNCLLQSVKLRINVHTLSPRHQARENEQIFIRLKPYSVSLF